MPVGLMDLPADLVHAVVEAYVRKADAKVVLGQGVWVVQLFLGRSAMAADGDAHRMVAERFGLARTSEAPTWEAVVHAVRAELERLDPTTRTKLFKVFDQDLHASPHELFRPLCKLSSVFLFRAVLEHGGRSSRDLEDALAVAIRTGRLDMVRLALDLGAPVDGTDVHETPLGTTIAMGLLLIVRVLLERGADRRRCYRRETLLSLAESSHMTTSPCTSRAIVDLLIDGP